ncbi:MAG: alpha/beta hydrolase [Legionella sp.]|nr:alpha/beta hydrolase [Legionella sp.]
MTPRTIAKQLVFILFCSISYIQSYAMGNLSPAEKLMNYTYLGQLSTDEAQTVLQKMPPLDSLQANYPLTLYKINYQTLAPNGDTTIASGLVAMPVLPQKSASIVSYQHGTRVTRDDVPSRNNERNYVYLATFGSYGGNMVVMPDYLGLGDNDLSVHPYVVAESLANSSIDMLIAAKELAKALKFPVNETLYLAGYSEGGFSTMVMYEELLKNHPDLPVTAAAPGSAPYDWHETIPFITLKPGPRATLYLAYFFYSCQTYNNYWTGMDEIFTKPYDTLIPVLFDGYHLIAEIQQALPLDPQLIFQPAFFESLINDTDRNLDQLQKNFNHYDFIASSPLLLVGTKGDNDVPYEGAEIAYNVLKSKSDNVYIKHVSDVLDHVEALPFVLKEQLEFFKHYQ